MAGVGVAPAQVGLQPAGQRRMVGVVRGAHRERAQRPELGLDRVGPGRVGRGEAQLDLVARGPGPDGGGLVRRQVVHDHVDRGAVRAGRTDRLERRQGVIAALAAPVHAPELVIAEAVAAVEVADAVRAVIGRRQPHRLRLPVPRSSRDRAGSTAARTGRTRNTASGNGWSHTRSGRACLLVRVARLLPGPGALETDLVLAQDLAQPFAPDPHPPVVTMRPRWAASLRTLQCVNGTPSGRVGWWPS